MTDDQYWRLVGTVVAMAVIHTFKPQILRFLYRIGYRDWRNPDWKPPEK